MPNKIKKIKLLTQQFDILPYVEDYEAGASYPKDSLVIKDKAIYRSKSSLANVPATLNTNDWEQVGGGSLFTNNNLEPSADTTAGWKALFEDTVTTGAPNKTGYFITWYTTAGHFTNQPQAFGFLETFLIGNDIYQRWHNQPNGSILWRSGNASGWKNATGTTTTGTWNTTYITRLTNAEVDTIWENN